MKKRYFSLVSVALVLALTSCKSGNDVDYKLAHNDLDDINTIISEHLEYSSSSHLDKESHTLTQVKQKALSTDYTAVLTVATYYKVVTDKNGKYGIYSTLDNAFLVTPGYISDTWKGVTSSVVNYNGTLFARYFKISVGEKYTYVDNYGNVIVTDSEDEYSFSTPSFDSKENAYYVSAKNLTTQKYIYIKYEFSNNGKASVVEKKDSNEVVYNIGDSFGSYTKTKINNDEYYLSYLVNGDLYTIVVLDSNKNIKKKVVVPYMASAAQALLFNNGTLLVQYSRLLPDDSAEYDYFLEGKKYSLYSLEYNLINNDQEKVKKLNFVIQSKTAVYDKEGKANYYQVGLKKILDNKDLGPSVKYLMKNDFSLANELAYGINGLIKTNSGYIANTDYFDVLLDSKLNYVATLNSTASDNYNAYVDAISVSANGKTGLIDSAGKVIVPFNYSSIAISSARNNKAYAIDQDGKNVILDIAKAEDISLEKYSAAGNLYYYINTEDYTTYFKSLYGDLEQNGSYSYQQTYSNFFGDKSIFVNTAYTSDVMLVSHDDYYFNTIA